MEAGGDEEKGGRMREVTVCATQMCCCPDREENIQRASDLVRAAREKEGAQIVLLQELFATRYFPQELREDHLDAAEAYEGSALLDRMAELAGDLGVVLPVSFFERSGNSFFNSVCVVDADGTKLGVYRKSHIPMGPGYEEKYYFAPGDTGFKVWNTRHAKVGVGICWDQWFPEVSRLLLAALLDLLTSLSFSFASALAPWPLMARRFCCTPPP